MGKSIGHVHKSYVVATHRRTGTKLLFWSGGPLAGGQGTQPASWPALSRPLATGPGSKTQFCSHRRRSEEMEAFSKESQCGEAPGPPRRSAQRACLGDAWAAGLGPLQAGPDKQSEYVQCSPPGPAPGTQFCSHRRIWSVLIEFSSNDI